MPSVFLNLMTMLLYLAAASTQWLAPARFGLPSRGAMLVFAVLAVLGHAYLLHYAIDTQWGQNLSVFNLASLAAWLIAILFIFLVAAKPLEKLGLILFPLAASSVFLAFCWPGDHMVATAKNLPQLLHILLAVVTFSVLAFAGIQSILLMLLDRQLHRKISLNWLNRLPPLETMESLLFQMISTGFILLTLLLISSIYFYSATIGPGFYSKTLVACLSWLVFAMLILGHYLLGWRGKKAVFCTALGVFIVLLLYFGAQQFTPLFLTI
jgi:ABC-type uncharacterized transport system permease subunit